MRRWVGFLFLTVILAAGLVLGAGCDSDSGGTDTAGGTDTVTGDDTAGGGTDTVAGEDAPAGTPTLVGTFATFNAGLAYDYVLYATERQPEIGPALAAVEADFVCLQEVWRPADAQAVLDATATAFPHSYWYDTTPLPNEGEGPACEAGPAGDFRACVEAADCENDARGLAGCAQAECGPEFAALSPDCLQCLVANLSKPLEEIFQACAEGSTLYLYDGANGLMLLSKHELTETGELLLDSTFNRRAVIYGRAVSGDGQSVAVFCTHTTPEFDGITYPGDYESWDGEQERQIGQMIEFVGEQTQDGDIAVLLGDMNDGPAIPPDIEGELEDNFQMFLDGGFVDPYADATGAQCTFCGANELNPSDTRNALIDHVFVKDDGETSWVFEASRILDAAVVPATPPGGEETMVPLSDHYGVMVKVSVE